MSRQNDPMRGRMPLRQRGALHQPQLPRQPRARARVLRRAGPAPAHRRPRRHATHPPGGPADVSMQ